MNLETMTDVELVEHSLTVVVGYPDTYSQTHAVDAEMRRRGTERMREAIRQAGEERDAARGLED